MEAVIVAGGLGTRVWPLTERHPKHLLPIAGVPFTVHQICKLASAGVEHVVLATSYRAEAFEPVLGDGRAYGVRLTYVTESEPLGTGGAIRNAARSLRSGPDDPVLVLNGDQLSGHDLVAEVALWRASGADVVLHLVRVADARSFGSVPTDASGRVLEFAEKSPDPITDQVNAGCYVFRRSVIEQIPPDRVVSVERETFPGLLDGGRVVVGYVDSAYWLDVGSPATVVQASRDLVTGVVRSAAFARPPADALVDSSAVVDETARITGGSSVGPNAVVGARAVVDGSILMGGATAGADAVVVDSVLGPRASVGPGARLRSAALGDGAVVPAGLDLDVGARIGSGEHVGDLEVGAQSSDQDS